MDRSFKNNADFKMNQQNFKLSDFGIDAKPPPPPPELRLANHSISNQCKPRRTSATTVTVTAVSQVGHHHRYVRTENARVPQQLSMMSPGHLSGSNLLQIACNRSHGAGLCNSSLMTPDRGNHHGNSPNQLGQMQNAPLADRFRLCSSSPSSSVSRSSPIVQLGSVPSPNCWKQYGGQESGVNISRNRKCVCVCVCVPLIREVNSPEILEIHQVTRESHRTRGKARTRREDWEKKRLISRKITAIRYFGRLPFSVRLHCLPPSRAMNG